MKIVGACVHDGQFAIEIIFCSDVAGKGESGFLFNRETVHVGPDEEGLTGPVLEETDDAESADALGDFESQGAHFGRQKRGGFLLAQRQFWVGVKVLVEFEDFGLGFEDALVDLWDGLSGCDQGNAQGEQAGKVSWDHREG